MNKLLNRKQWGVKYKDFCKRHAWLNFQKDLSSAPGWLDLMDACLNDLEEVFQVIGQEKLTFFGLVFLKGNDREINIYVDFNTDIGSARITLCKEIIKQAINHSSGTCFKCGALHEGTEDQFGHRPNRACEAHAEFDGVFFEEYQEWEVARINELCNQTREEHVEDACPSSTTAKEQQGDEVVMTEDEKPVITPPSAKLYDLEEIQLMLTDQSNDRNINQKRKDLAKKMLKLGERRDFCPVPQASVMAQSLRAAFPNFSKVVDFIEIYVALAFMTGKLYLPPIMLEGIPGIGKTKFTSELATWLNTTYIELHMENEQSNSTLAGSSEYWGNSQTGVLFDKLVFGKTCNPLVVVDEVDKAQIRDGLNPLSPLYQLLERDTAKQFRDLGFRAVALDASYVLWILTANNVSKIDTPILSRVRCFVVEAPTPAQAAVIAQRIYSNVLERNEWTELFDAELTTQSAQKLATYLPRQMQAEIEVALGNVVNSGRKTLLVSDIGKSTYKAKRGIGFL